jgi:hypothetical protein
LKALPLWYFFTFLKKTARLSTDFTLGFKTLILTESGKGRFQKPNIDKAFPVLTPLNKRPFVFHVNEGWSSQTLRFLF